MKWFTILISDTESSQTISLNGVTIYQLHSMRVWPKKKRLPNGQIREITAEDVPDYQGPETPQQIGEYLIVLGDLMKNSPPQPPQNNP